MLMGAFGGLGVWGFGYFLRSSSVWGFKSVLGFCFIWGEGLCGDFGVWISGVYGDRVKAGELREG